jgi:regulator of sirC expression with transglutaminase-like and TPR domain
MAVGSNPVAETFAALVGRRVEDERIDLANAALTIARTEYPALKVESYLARIDGLAARVRDRISEWGEPAQTIPALSAVLFEEERFRGNREDYYDVRNSFLNDVLDRRLGIPITLSLLYMEVGRRVGFPLFGVGMPGHFIVKHYDVEGRQVLIDPYNGGRVVTPSDCQRRLDEIYSGQISLQPEFLLPVSRRQMLTRMLNNLKNTYLAVRNFRRALPIVDMILAIYPRSPEDVKQRAMLRHSLGNVRGAVDDLEDYLKMSPEASDSGDDELVLWRSGYVPVEVALRRAGHSAVGRRSRSRAHIEIGHAAQHLPLLIGEVVAHSRRIQRLLPLLGTQTVQTAKLLPQRLPPLRRQIAKLLKDVSRPVPLVLVQTAPRFHTVQHLLALRGRPAGEVLQTLTKLFLPCGRQAAKPGIALQFLLLFRGGKVLVLAQPLSGTRRGTVGAATLAPAPLA